MAGVRGCATLQERTAPKPDDLLTRRCRLCTRRPQTRRSVLVTMTQSPTGQRPKPQRPDDDRFVSLAAELGARCAEHAAAHDRDNTFVEESFALLKEAGYTALAIPEELGGLGGSLRQVCYAQAELARYCAATALAVNMHI